MMRFNLDHNQGIDILLEKPNLIYISNNSEVKLTRDKIQVIVTETVALISRPIPKQDVLEVIEQTLLEPEKFRWYEIDLVKLISKKYPYTRENIKNRQRGEHYRYNSSIGGNAPFRKSLKAIYPSLPQHYYLEII